MSYAYTAYWGLSHELQPRRSPGTVFPESRPTDSLPANPQCGRLGDAPPEPEPGSQLWPGGSTTREDTSSFSRSLGARFICPAPFPRPVTLTAFTRALSFAAGPLTTGRPAET